MASPIPRSSLFNLTVSVHRAERFTIDGKLDDWSERNFLPQVSLEGRPPFATVSMAWSAEGLWFACSVPRTKAPQVIPKRLASGDCLELYIDTRDIRSAHRAGRYCHKFVVAPVGGAGRGRNPIFEHQEIQRALATPPLVQPDEIDLASEVRKDGYTMEMFFPASTLTGYDVEINRRLGLAYVLHDIEREMQVWPHQVDLPVWIDPGLWAVVELVE
jgi:hypothetical protein